MLGKKAPLGTRFNRSAFALQPDGKIVLGGNFFSVNGIEQLSLARLQGDRLNPRELETPQANLVAGMKWLQNTYTIRFNRRHRLSGHLFQGRYKAVLVDPDERSYFLLLADYIHLNAARAKLLKSQESILK